MDRPTSTLAAALLGVLVTTPASAQEALTGKLGTELRYFPRGAAHPGQSDGLASSMSLEPELYVDSDSGDAALLVVGFLRVDEHDRRRSHADLRELQVRGALSRELELRAGVSRVFWGVAESKHLVNVINQVDLIESPDAESYLGQPMLQLTWLASDALTIDLFALSGFRERTFAGPGGRLRGPLPVDGEASYASRLARAQPEGALRASVAAGPLDLGLHYFFGTRRDPELRLVQQGAAPVVRPHYGLMHRVGLDGLIATGSSLLKLEAIARTDSRGGELELAATGGIEHTLVGLIGVADLGLLLEYSYDQRDPFSALFLENDVFAGMRLALNDVDSTELLLGGAVHHDLSSALLVAEASRRLTDALSFELEARFFVAPTRERPEYALRRDGHVQAQLLAHF